MMVNLVQPCVLHRNILFPLIMRHGSEDDEQSFLVSDVFKSTDKLVEPDDSIQDDNWFMDEDAYQGPITRSRAKISKFTALL